MEAVLYVVSHALLCLAAGFIGARLGRLLP